MHPEIKQMWIDALRSGDFKQGKRFLKHEDKYCCLGVLCQITLAQDLSHKFMILDRNLIKTLGIKETIIYELAKMNDGPIWDPKLKSKTFSQIADWIEENL